MAFPRPTSEQRRERSELDARYGKIGSRPSRLPCATRATTQPGARRVKTGPRIHPPKADATRVTDKRGSC